MVGIPILLARMLIIDASSLNYIPPAIAIYLGIVFILSATRKDRDKHKE